MARRVKKTLLQERTESAKNAIEDMALVKCPVEEYLEALEDVQNHIESSIDAAKDDIRRKKQLEREG